MHPVMRSAFLLLLLQALSITAEDIPGEIEIPQEPGSRSSLFLCGLKYCPSGTDCFTVNGSKQCLDPCDYHSALDDPRRSVTSPNDPDAPLDDRSAKWDGWYRLFLSGANARMPDSCVEEGVCGTLYPLWLRTPHPRPQDGIARSTVCAARKGSCCRYDSKDIHVKACPGGFYIYKFVAPSMSKSAYCAAVTELPTTTSAKPTTPKPTTTTPEPTTTTTTPPPTTTTTTTPAPPPPTTPRPTTPKPTTTTPKPTTTTPKPTTTTPKPTTTTPKPTTTTPKPTTTTPEPTTATTPKPTTTTPKPTTTPEPTTKAPKPTIATTTTPEPTTTTTTTPPGPPVTPELVCGRDVIQIGLPTSALAARGLNASTAHLADRLCSAHDEKEGRVWYLVERKEGSCGNILKTNDSHAIFSNNIFVYPMAVAPGILLQPIRIHLSCVYPMDTETSLNVAIKPNLTMGGAGIVSGGSRAAASMSLYRSSNYTEPYPGGRATLPVGSTLYVGVAVEETESERFVVVLEDCYVNHSPDPEDLVRYYLIENKCSSDLREVAVDESGSSLQARFSALLFLYQGDYQDVFLHCSLSLCDQRSSSCSPMCFRRRRRSVSQTIPLKPLTVGPITWN